MKRIPLRVESDTRFPPDSPEFAANVLSWSEAIRQIVRRPLDAQKGAEIDEIRRGIRIYDALERATDTLELEDSDWEHLRDKTRAMQWAFVDRRIAALVEDILEATDQVPLNSHNGVAVG